jgi:hypothetical protein
MEQAAGNWEDVVEMQSKDFPHPTGLSILEVGSGMSPIKQFYRMIPLELVIPEQQVLVGTQERAITQRHGAIVSLVAFHTRDCPHLIARM